MFDSWRTPLVTNLDNEKYSRRRVKSPIVEGDDGRTMFPEKVSDLEREIKYRIK